MEQTRPLIAVLDDDSRFKRFTQKLRTLGAGRSTGNLRRRPVLPPEADASVTVRRVLLGSAVEFMQREYFTEPQPTSSQQERI
jgi:hypothetical protein